MHSQPSVFSSLQGFLRKTQNAAAHVAHGSARLNVHNPGTTGVSVGPVGLIAGAAFALVKPGETILLFGTGFGTTNPTLPAGKLVTKAEPLANNVTVTIGGEP